MWELADIAVTILVAAVGGLLGWVYKIQNTLHAHQLSVARDYHSKAEIREVMTDLLRPVHERLSEISTQLRDSR
jgi:hypothetical protein